MQIVLLDVIINWSNVLNNVAVHSVVVNSNHHHITDDIDPSPQILSDDRINDNHHLLNRQKRVLVFRPLFVYKQQQKEKQKMREEWKIKQELQSNYEQQYYQQYLQNYYNQFASTSGYYQNYNQPNYPYVQPIQNAYSNVDDEQFNYWNTGSEQYDQYYNPYQHTESYYNYPSSTAHNPSQYHSSLSSEYSYDF